MLTQARFLKVFTAMTVAILLLSVTTPLLAQSTLSQNQDGFNGETMDGFMDVD